MPTTDRYVVKEAFLKSIPIMCSYVFVSMAYGIMMENAGFAWYDVLAVSLTVYTGAFQFVLVTLLSSGASIITIALTAFLMNSRQSFYGSADHILFKGWNPGGPDDRNCTASGSSCGRHHL